MYVYVGPISINGPNVRNKSNMDWLIQVIDTKSQTINQAQSPSWQSLR